MKRNFLILATLAIGSFTAVPAIADEATKTTTQSGDAGASGDGDLLWGNGGTGSDGAEGGDSGAGGDGGAGGHGGLILGTGGDGGKGNDSGAGGNAGLIYGTGGAGSAGDDDSGGDADSAAGENDSR